MLNSLLRARGVSCYCHGGSRLICALAILLSFATYANEFNISPLPVSPYADTEVTTNIVFNATRIDVKRFELNFSLISTPSNCIQVAFGRDVNQDGVLTFAETDTIYGWRNGYYVIEDVRQGSRYAEKVQTSQPGESNFNIKMRMKKDYTPKEFAASVGSLQIFSNFSRDVPSWLYLPTWNMMRVTRRGVDVPSEWISCGIDYRYFYITIR
jgi:hypothetical protein